MLTHAQKVARQLGVAASEIGAVMGLNPWKGPFDVWRDKVEPIADEPEVDNPHTDWGNRIEEPIRGWYADTLGVEVTVPGTLTHPRDPLAIATPDGVVYPIGASAPRNGLEIKKHTVNLRHLYGEPGTDEVPAWELAQCAWNMYVTGLPFWHLAAFIDGLPTLYRIDRDAEFEGLMVEARDRFWQDHVMARIPPPPDGTKAYTAELARRYPSSGAVTVGADDTDVAVIAELRSVRDRLWELARAEARLEQHLKGVIGAGDGISWKSGKVSEVITWRKPRDSIKVDWEAVARARGFQADLMQSGALAALETFADAGTISAEAANGLRMALGLDGAPESTDNVIRQYTKVVPGSRRFCVPRSWSRERPTDVDIDKEHRSK